MLVEIKVPVLAESVADATLGDWLKKPGEAVSRGENLIEIETDKVVLEVSAPNDGILKEIKKNNAETVLSEEVIAVIDTEGSPPPAAGAQPIRKLPDTSDTDEASVTDEPQLSPAVRKLLEENNLQSSQIKGSGKNGRITKSDVQDYLKSQPQPSAVPQTEPLAVEKPAPVRNNEFVTPGDRIEERVPMTRLRKRVAERLLDAQHQNAILTTFNEVNMAPVMELRKRYRDKFEEVHSVRLGFMSFFVMATIEALKRFPVVNASIDGDDILYHGYFDIGIAVSSPRGLVVPIVRDADQMTMAEIEKQINEYGTKAKEGSLSMEELTGGTFTLTNGGVFGSLMSTPILNPPQSAILGMHKIQERPMAENGEVVIRPMMYLALSYDHRIIDGREAVQFLVAIKEQLEDPSRLLLHI